MDPEVFASLLWACNDAGVRYEGVQESPRGKLLVFTEPESGSTGMLALDQLTPQALSAKAREIRQRFGLEETRCQTCGYVGKWDATGVCGLCQRLAARG